MQIYITDKTGDKFWPTDVNARWAQGERNNLARHLAGIKSGKAAYAFVDAATARIVEEGVAIEDDISDDDLLASLFG